MKKPNFNTTKLKTQVEENPLIAAGVAAALLSGAVRLLNAISENRNSKTYRREVLRREKKDKKR